MAEAEPIVMATTRSTVDGVKLMNGRLRKLGKFAKETARVEKQSAAKMTRALMNEHKVTTSKLGEYMMGSSMGRVS